MVVSWGNSYGVLEKFVGHSYRNSYRNCREVVWGAQAICREGCVGFVGEFEDGFAWKCAVVVGLGWGGVGGVAGKFCRWASPRLAYSIR